MCGFVPSILFLQRILTQLGVQLLATGDIWARMAVGITWGLPGAGSPLVSTWLCSMSLTYPGESLALGGSRNVLTKHRMSGVEVGHTSYWLCSVGQVSSLASVCLPVKWILRLLLRGPGRNLIVGRSGIVSWMPWTCCSSPSLSAH